MSNNISRLQAKLQANKKIILSEMKPDSSGSPAKLREICKRYDSHVDALGIADNRDEITTSALASASLSLAEGVEPILHITTRDRNRIALISEVLGARALGLYNLLITSGTHQTLGSYAEAKNVHDIDVVQFLSAISGRDTERDAEDDAAPFFAGAVTDPYADPIDMQIIQIEKKIAAGAKFLITKPIFDLERFHAWWKKITERGIENKVAIIAGIKILSGYAEAEKLSASRPDPMLPKSVLSRLSSNTDKNMQKSEGKKIALETIKAVLAIDRIRGIEITSDCDQSSVLEIIDAVKKSGV
jgi:methylenetetrahydrofolate reductase (NADPH)